MNKLKLIHSKDKFLLEINDTPIHFVNSYKIETGVEKITELTLKIAIDMEKSFIDIEKYKTPVAPTTDVNLNLLLNGKTILEENHD